MRSEKSRHALFMTSVRDVQCFSVSETAFKICLFVIHSNLPLSNSNVYLKKKKVQLKYKPFQIPYPNKRTENRKSEEITKNKNILFVFSICLLIFVLFVLSCFWRFINFHQNQIKQNQ